MPGPESDIVRQLKAWQDRLGNAGLVELKPRDRQALAAVMKRAAERIAELEAGPPGEMPVYAPRPRS